MSATFLVDGVVRNDAFIGLPRRADYALEFPPCSSPVVKAGDWLKLTTKRDRLGIRCRLYWNRTRRALVDFYVTDYGGKGRPTLGVVYRNAETNAVHIHWTNRPPHHFEIKG